MNRVKEAIEDYGYQEEILVYENPDYADAFIGVSNDDRAVYQYEKMVECLMEYDEISEEDARDFIDYNCIGFGGGAINGVEMPIVVYPVELCDYDKVRDTKKLLKEIHNIWKGSNIEQHELINLEMNLNWLECWAEGVERSKNAKNDKGD